MLVRPVFILNQHIERKNYEQRKLKKTFEILLTFLNECLNTSLLFGFGYNN